MTITDGTLTITQALLAVTADNQSRAYGVTNPVLTANYSGFVNGETVSVLSGELSLTTLATENSPVGAYPITAAVGTLSSTNYAFSFVDGTLTIGPALLTVTAENQNRVYGATNPVFTASYTGFVNGDTASVLRGEPSLMTLATASSPVGTYPITAAVGTLSATNYAFSVLDGTLTIGQALLKVTAENQSRVYGAINPVFTASYTGFVNGDTASVLSGEPSLTTLAVESSPAGAYPITAAVGTLGATNYGFSFVDGTLTIGQALLTVTAENQSRVYGATNPVFTAGYSGFANGDTASVLSGEPSLTTLATASSPVGAYPLTAAVGTLSATNYAFSFVDGTLTIGQALLTVTAENQSRVYGATNPVFTASYAGFVNGDTASVLSGEPSLTTLATASSPVGAYPITAAVGTLSATNYAFSLVDGTLTIGQSTLTVTADALTKWYGQSDPALTYRITSGRLVNGESLSGVLSRMPGEDAGTYAILQGTLAASTNYSLVYVGTNLTIWPNWLLVMAEDQSRSYGATNPVLTISYSGFVGTDGVTNLTELPQASTLAQAGSAVGDYEITVTGGSATNYRLTLVSGTMTVTPAELTVVAGDATRGYGTTNPVLSGTITGIQNNDNITATYSSTATATSPVGGYPITSGLVDPGGKLGNYTVSSTNGTLTVEPALLRVVGDNASRAYGQPNPAFRATISGWVNGEDTNVLGGELELSSPATTNSPVGDYPIIAGGLTSTNYGITFSNGTLRVTAYALSVSASNQSRAYGAANPELTGRVEGLQNGDNITATYATVAEINSPMGGYPITIGLLDPDGRLSNYAVTTNNGMLTVSAAALRVVAHDASRAYGATNPVVSGTISGIQNGDNITATYATTATETSPVGGYAITPTLVDPGSKLSNYAVTSTNGTLTVNPATVTVTADALTKWYGQSDPALTYRITSGRLVNGESLSGVLSRMPGEDAGTYAILQGTLAASTNYSLVYVGTNLTIWPNWLLVMAEDQSRSYGATNPVLTISYSGFVGTDGVTNLTELPQASTLAQAGSAVGDYEITVTGGSATNYRLTLVSGTMTVTPAELTVVAGDASRGYGTTNPVLSGTITGIQNNDNITATYSSTATATSPVGGYPITSGLVDPGGKLGNYTVSSTNGTLTVEPALLRAPPTPRAGCMARAIRPSP